MPILGALLAAGLAAGGAAIAARRNKQTNAQNTQLSGQNTQAINTFANQYGNTFNASTQRATGGADMYANALGLNGAAGNTIATNAFQAGPGYQYALDQAQTAAERGASAGGYLASGNLLGQLQTNAVGMANQEYGNWVGNLGGFVGEERAGLENRVGLGSQITQARMGNTQNQIDRNQATINGRQQMIGNLLGFAGNMAGRAGAGGGGSMQSQFLTNHPRVGSIFGGA
jgi:hypothetical protein